MQNVSHFYEETTPFRHLCLQKDFLNVASMSFSFNFNNTSNVYYKDFFKKRKRMIIGYVRLFIVNYFSILYKHSVMKNILQYLFNLRSLYVQSLSFYKSRKDPYRNFL